MYGGSPEVKEIIKSMRVQGSGFRVSPWGVLSLECVRKLYSPVRSEELGVRSGGAAHKN